MSPLTPIAALILAILAAPVLAQDVRLYRQSEAVDPHEVARILDPGAAHKSGIKMRSLRVLGDSPSDQAQPAPEPVQAARVTQDGQGAQPAPSEAQQPVPDALALPVQFAFDSAVILPAARGQLDALAQGIRMLPEPKTVVIEGHTDASGSEVYNDQLSARRAYSVKQYLVSMHHIDPARLKTVGMGEGAPLAGRDPHSADNRRVQFRGE